MKRQIESQGLIGLWDWKVLDVNPFKRPVQFTLDLKHSLLSHKILSHKIFSWLTLKQDITLSCSHVLIKWRIFNKTFAFERVPLRAFQGIAIRVSKSDKAKKEFKISINLHHEKECYCLPLYHSHDLDDALIRLQTWSRVLDLPSLMPTLDGSWRATQQKQKMQNDLVFMRHPRQYLKARKPIYTAIREVGKIQPEKRVIGREMIAPE